MCSHKRGLVVDDHHVACSSPTITLIATRNEQVLASGLSLAVKCCPLEGLLQSRGFHIVAGPLITSCLIAGAVANSMKRVVVSTREYQERTQTVVPCHSGNVEPPLFPPL